jgi:phage terminase small subunit
MTKELTEKQERFLSVLFDEAGGDFVLAKKMAGYSDNTATREVVEPLGDEISELTKKFVKNSAIRAAVEMVNVIKDPTALGNREKITAAKDILDRAGYKPTDKVEVSAPNPLFILPAKE